MLDLLTIWFCKLIYWILRRLGKHGAALPGLIAEKLRPGLLHKLTNLPDGIIVVSGTNGKTTTTHLTTQALRKAHKRVFTNHSGSNMTRGLLAGIVRYSSLRGQLPYDIAVLEIDEAYASKLAARLQPRGAILTNVLRDQLDRFGEIDHTAELLFNLAREVSGVVAYNACDSRLARVAKMQIKAKTISFGYAQQLKEHFPDDDTWYGDSKALIQSSDYTLKFFDGSNIRVGTAKQQLNISSSKLPGWHNALNLTAVVALLSELYGLDSSTIYSDLTPPYGRGEVMVVNGCRLVLQLVKNPAGFRTAMDVEPSLPALIVVNDAIADSRDVSWLWDVDVAPLAARPTIYTSGSRAYDMAVRLKYNEITVVNINTDVKSSVDGFIHDNRGGVVFLTYTSMLQVRTYLNKLMQKHQKGPRR